MCTDHTFQLLTTQPKPTTRKWANSTSPIHKSYHPYRRDNIERVRRDEEEAARKDAEQEGKISLADAEARLSLLRDRAGIGKGGKWKAKARRIRWRIWKWEVGSDRVGRGSGSGKHINLFEDLEQHAMITTARASKKTAPSEAEKGVPLAPSAKDLNPWYTGTTKDRNEPADDLQDEKRKRDLLSKSRNDPLTAITQQLASRSSSNGVSRASLPSINSPTRPPPKQLDPTTVRLSRESSERQRALELIRRRKREMEGSETPSTVHGGMDGGYGDVYNRRELDEAHAHRDRWRHRGW
ncbi:hypothetical protein BU15DRAFT_50968 [Melanogaster broomeanus]|nr:hypothetical protein BU15DRAFT_50968 [Melanogaster broomeanus]